MLHILLYLLLIRAALGRITGNQLKYGYSNKRIADWEYKYQYWPVFSTGELPGKPSDMKLYFYQTLVNLVAPSDILYYKITLIFDGGIIVLVNGNEVYRQFLSNDLKDSTAPDRSDVKGHQTIKILPYYFINGLNLFSFEFHSVRASLSDPFEMAIDVETSANNCSKNLNSPSMYYHATNAGETKYRFDQAFDGSPSTKYYVKGAIVLRFTMFFAEPQGFNKFVFIGADDCCARSPEMFEILGIMKPPETYGSKSTFTDKKFLSELEKSGKGCTCPYPQEVTHLENPKFEVVPYEIRNKRAYNGYSFYVTGSKYSSSKGCPSGLQFSELEMYSCKINKCLGDNKLPEAFAGTKIVKPCPHGSTMINYTCLDTGIWKATGSCPSK